MQVPLWPEGAREQRRWPITGAVAAWAEVRGRPWRGVWVVVPLRGGFR